MRTNRSACALTALAAVLLLGGAGCGGPGNYESIYFYVINGYPSASSLSVIGNAGTIVSNAAFGDRMGERGLSGQVDGVCTQKKCTPIEVDRSLGSDMTVIMDGTPQPIDMSRDFFAMYPQETSTLVFTRRSDTDNVDATVLRHTQTISSDCSLTFVNGLSLSNQYLAEVNNFSVAPEFKLDNLATAGFVDETKQPFLTECGPLPTGTKEHNELARSDLYAKIKANPWFFPVKCQNSGGAQPQDVFCFGYGVPQVDGRSRLYSQGQVIGKLNSKDYFKCVEQAITVNQNLGNLTGQTSCPMGDLTWADVTVDKNAVAACQADLLMTAETLDPGKSDTTQTFLGPFLCNTTFRIRNQGQDLIFGPKSGQKLGLHQNGQLVSSSVNIPHGSQHFWVMLGRPVNPIVWQWDSGDAFVNLASKPYLNQQNARVGHYSWNQSK